MQADDVEGWRKDLDPPQEYRNFRVKRSIFLLSMTIAFFAVNKNRFSCSPNCQAYKKVVHYICFTAHWLFGVFFSTLPAHLTFIHPISSHLCAIDNTNEVESSDQESKYVKIYLSIWVYFLLKFQIELQTILKNQKRNISCIYKTDIFFWCDFHGWAKFKPMKNIVSKNIL